MKYSIITLLLLALLSSFTVSSELNNGDDPADCLDELDVPKRFTPNGDEENDIFSIPFPCDPQTFEIEIFDRFDAQLFVSKDFKFAWTGNDLKGNPCQNDVYNWKIRYMYQMNYVEVSGQVLLLR